MKEETKVPEVENNTDNIESVQEGPNSNESKPVKRGRKKTSEPKTEEPKTEEPKTEEPKTEEPSVSTELPEEDNSAKIPDKRARFLRYPVYIYMKKSKRSPILGGISGKVFEICKESTDEWICITCGISGVGKVTGYIYRKDAPII